MKNSVILKSLMAVTVLTTATGSALFVGNGITHEAKAQQENPNAGHFHKEVDGKSLDFTDTFEKTNLLPKTEKTNLLPKTLAEEIANKLKGQSLDPSKYSFKLYVEKQVELKLVILTGD